MSDIVERLRNRFHGIEQLRDPAADTIEALRAENARLRKALERLAGYGNIFGYAKWESNPYEQAMEALATKEQS